MKIRIWGDFACPFCYMEGHILEDVLVEVAEAGRDIPEVEFRAYELDPDAPVEPTESMEEHYCKEHGVSPDVARSQMARITKMAERAGLTYNLEGVKVCSTFDAHRLMKLAYDKYDAETAKSLNTALFHANFVDNERLSDHDVLRKIATSVGMEIEEVDGVLSSDRYGEAVRKDEQKAKDEGLEYVPYMKFSDGEVLQGVISKGAMKKAIGAF